MNECTCVLRQFSWWGGEAVLVCLSCSLFWLSKERGRAPSLIEVRGPQQNPPTDSPFRRLYYLAPPRNTISGELSSNKGRPFLEDLHALFSDLSLNHAKGEPLSFPLHLLLFIFAGFWYEDGFWFEDEIQGGWSFWVGRRWWDWGLNMGCGCWRWWIWCQFQG